jgi:predicted ribosome quality control (RQC) complex YloA/Tae2 family protein
MKIKIDINKSIEKNAAEYFEKSKKAKKKIEGAKQALQKSLKKLEKLKKEKPKEKKKPEKKRKKEWYEKFRWFISSEGFLCIGGRDATTNEIIIKKYAEANDLVFHTDIAGSPFFIIKTEGKKPGEKTIKETAKATASFSKAWKLGLGNMDVFYVNPEQVTKKAKAGEYLQKGAFMIYGKKNYIKSDINLAIGISKERIMAGPVDAVKKNTEKFIIIEQGKEKTSSVAKKIQKKIGGDLDDIIRALPAGGCKA